VVDAERMPRQTFEEAVLPHLDAAFNDARWPRGFAAPCRNCRLIFLR